MSWIPIQNIHESERTIPRTSQKCLACGGFSNSTDSSWPKRKFHRKVTVKEGLGGRIKINIILSNKTRTRVLDFNAKEEK